MRLVRHTEVASANFQCCGVWLQCRGTIIALLPEWWRSDRDNRRRYRPFRFGVKIWAWDHNGGLHTVFGLYTRNIRVRYARAFHGRDAVSEGCSVGWSLWRSNAKG